MINTISGSGLFQDESGRMPISAPQPTEDSGGAVRTRSAVAEPDRPGREGTRPGRDRSHLAPDYFIEGMEQSNRANAPHSSDEEQSRKAA